MNLACFVFGFENSISRRLTLFLRKESILAFTPVWLSVLLFLTPRTTIFAAEMVVDCTDAALRGALAASDHVQIACTSTILLTNTLVIDHDLILEGLQEGVTISGNQQHRIFQAAAGVTLDLQNISLAFGMAQGEAGGNEVAEELLDGQPGMGGAIWGEQITLSMMNCRFLTNHAMGGVGGVNIGQNRSGQNGPAMGGAIYLAQSSVNVTNCGFVGNIAMGASGQQANIPEPNAGGSGHGGALYLTNSSLQLELSTLEYNQATGGEGSAGEFGFFRGKAGDGMGGAIYVHGPETVIARSAFNGNLAFSTNPFGNPRRGAGGSGLGGALVSLSDQSLIRHSMFHGNRVQGSKGSPEDAPGHGAGGAIYAHSLKVEACRFMLNEAQAGSGGPFGGLGQGGAVAAFGEQLVTNSLFELNSAYGGAPSLSTANGEPQGNGAAQGGAYYTTNGAHITKSTFTGNRALGPDGTRAEGGIIFDAGHAEGGAIWSGDYLIADTMTLHNNIAAGGDWVEDSAMPCASCGVGGDGRGGGIYLGHGGQIAYATFSDNSAAGGQADTDGQGIGGAFYVNSNATVIVFASILNGGESGGNCSPNFTGELLAGAYVISSDDSCQFNENTDLGNLHETDPILGPLGDYGGPTPTLPLLAGSPALNGVLSNVFSDIMITYTFSDQRGHPRSFPDIGAFESTQPYFLAGQIQGFKIADVEVLLNGTQSTLTDSEGFYAFDGLEGGEYVVTPMDPESIFEPSSQTVFLGPDSLSVDFTSMERENTNGLVSIILANCTDAALREAIATADHVQIACAAPILLTNTLVIDHDLILEGTVEGAGLSGQEQHRILEAAPGIQLSLRGLTFANGLAQGAPGEDDNAETINGMPGLGGALYGEDITVHVDQCQFLTNRALGGPGGVDLTQKANGVNGRAEGGAIHLTGSTLHITNSFFLFNEAIGASGRMANVSHQPGGIALGGAVYTHNTEVQSQDCAFRSNLAQGGTGTLGELNLEGGPSGFGEGGAVFIHGDSAIANFFNTEFTDNIAASVNNPGIRDGHAGHGSGGAIKMEAQFLSIQNCSFQGNQARGSDSRRFSQPGSSTGGAIHANYVELAGSTFQDNLAQAGNGGQHGGRAYGGAIFVNGDATNTLKVVNSWFQSNVARGGQPTRDNHDLGEVRNGFSQGGAIYSRTNLSVHASTFVENRAEGPQGSRAASGIPFPGGWAEGGAIWSRGELHARNATFFGNQARGGDWIANDVIPCPGCGIGGDARGGALFLQNSAQLDYLTLSQNAAVPGQAGTPGTGIGGGFYANTNSTINVHASILDQRQFGGNCSPNFSGTMLNSSFNISSDRTCHWNEDTAVGNLDDTDPILGPLGDYGGPTPTMPLLTHSPAVDFVSDGPSVDVDQRGRARPFGAYNDAGAFESSPPYSIVGQLSGYHFAGIEFTLDQTISETTDETGLYQFSGLDAGLYVIKPHDPETVFQPNELNVMVGPDAAFVDFKGYRTNHITVETIEDSTSLQFTFAGPSNQPIDVYQSMGIVFFWELFVETSTDNHGFFFWEATPGTNTSQRFFKVGPADSN